MYWSIFWARLPANCSANSTGEYETDCADTRTGDVKYHQGASSDIMTAGGNVHIALSFNPSHLEIISPVVEGSVRARQERRKDTARKQVIPDSDSWGCRICRTGGGHGNLEHGCYTRILHRRYDSYNRQQSNWFHHQYPGCRVLRFIARKSQNWYRRRYFMSTVMILMRLFLLPWWRWNIA